MAVDAVEDRLARIDHERFLADWAFHTGRSRTGSLRWQVARARLLSHPDLIPWCREARPRVVSVRLCRRLELLERNALDAQLQHHPSVARLNDRIERQISAFRPRWKGRPVRQAELWDLVSREPDPRFRRSGYYANEPLFRALEPDVRSLLSARNQRARDLGFANFPEARLSLEGMSVRALEALMDTMLSLGPTLARPARGRAGVETWYPWDFMFAHWQETNPDPRAFAGQECMAAVVRGLRAWGFGKRDLDFRFRRFDTPTAGLALHGDAPRDVGVVANPRDGWVYYGVLFHEMGHGIHAAAVRGPSHLLRDPGFAVFEESIGGLFESIPSEPNWLLTRPGMTKSEALRLRKAGAEGLVLRMGELIGEIRTELALYRNPEADPTDERKRFLRRWLAYDDHEPVSWVDLYYHNPGFTRPGYLVSACFDEQVFAAALREVGGDLWPNPELGRWIRGVWLRPGQRDDWFPKLRKVTGRDLSADAFVRATRAKAPGP